MAATAVLESVWIYALMAVFGLLTNQGGSPLSWPAALTILGVSLIVARTSAIVIMPSFLPYVLQMVLGTLVIYLTLGAQVPPEGQGFSLGWISGLYSDTAELDYPVRVGLAGLFGTFLWWRGGRLASVEFPVEHLNKIFRVGLMVLAAAAVADIIAEQDLRIFPLMFVYFAAGLGGLSFGHLLPASQRTAGARSWPRVISGIIGLVLLVGLMFGLLQQTVLNFISEPAAVVLNALATVIFFVLILPVVYIIEFLVSGLFSLFRRFAGEGEPVEIEFGGGVGETLQQLQEQAGETGPSAFLQYVEWTLVAVLILVVLFLLARTFRRRVRWRRTGKDGVRESVAEGADAATDLRRLLLDLLPDRFRRKDAAEGLQLPDDDPAIVDVFRVYFGMLVMAEERGRPRPDNQTPHEYRPTLERILPQRLVRMATDAFVRACYGRRAADPEQIDEMRRELERASSEG